MLLSILKDFSHKDVEPAAFMKVKYNGPTLNRKACALGGAQKHLGQ